MTSPVRPLEQFSMPDLRSSSEKAMENGIEAGRKARAVFTCAVTPLLEKCNKSLRLTGNNFGTSTRLTEDKTEQELAAMKEAKSVKFFYRCGTADKVTSEWGQKVFTCLRAGKRTAAVGAFFGMPNLLAFMVNGFALACAGIVKYTGLAVAATVKVIGVPVVALGALTGVAALFFFGHPFIGSAVVIGALFVTCFALIGALSIRVGKLEQKVDEMPAEIEKMLSRKFQEYRFSGVLGSAKQMLTQACGKAGKKVGSAAAYAYSKMPTILNRDYTRFNDAKLCGDLQRDERGNLLQPILFATGERKLVKLVDIPTALLPVELKGAQAAAKAEISSYRKKLAFAGLATLVAASAVGYYFAPEMATAALSYVKDSALEAGKYVADARYVRPVVDFAQNIGSKISGSVASAGAFVSQGAASALSTGKSTLGAMSAAGQGVFFKVTAAATGAKDKAVRAVYGPRYSWYDPRRLIG